MHLRAPNWNNKCKKDYFKSLYDLNGQKIKLAANVGSRYSALQISQLKWQNSVE